LRATKSIAVLRRDPHLARLITRLGYPSFKWNNFERGNAFQSLCRSIIYQQISGRAAAAILTSFVKLFPVDTFPTPERVCRISPEKLRKAGLSAQKASYIKDLALKFSNGIISHDALQKMTNAEIVENLTRVKGIGPWTAHMFMIFTLNRRDVLPTGDLGIRKGFQIVYELKTLPNHAKMERIAKHWRAHASIASWYFWRVADETKLRTRIEGRKIMRK
jgi:DNA-3-methyladenine glycosylase II